jgi:S-methylmethionine-dependent homocysteine/selenocysteine methylase
VSAPAQALLLDGPTGTELERRGIPTHVRGWSAPAIVSAPDVLGRIHADYAAAGATVHTACTFRTKRRSVGPEWRALATRAVEIARTHVPVGHRVAGSVAPLEDCYRPDLAPPSDVARAEHRELCEALAEAGADLLLCEAFASPREAAVATEEAARTGLETWTALTAGPSADLLSPRALAEAARACLSAGARVVLVNCVGWDRIGPFVAAVADLGAPFGYYANAGDLAPSPEAYAALAQRWVGQGARVVGGCCGLQPSHVAACLRVVE